MRNLLYLRLFPKENHLSATIQTIDLQSNLQNY